jgi:hypothetical protein
MYQVNVHHINGHAESGRFFSQIKNARNAAKFAAKVHLGATAIIMAGVSPTDHGTECERYHMDYPAMICEKSA